MAQVEGGRKFLVWDVETGSVETNFLEHTDCLLVETISFLKKSHSKGKLHLKKYSKLTSNQTNILAVLIAVVTCDLNDLHLLKLK
jgi:hypothetical protein